MVLNQRNVLLAGATGLVGGLTLGRLLENRQFTGKVLVPSRRQIATTDSRTQVLVTDFSSGADSELTAAIDASADGRLDVFVCCLGTTLKSAGSREAFIAVDRDLALRLARVAFDKGARHAILVSSAGASRQSGTFYLRVKGEVEDAFKKLGFERLDILQPGLLLGQRKQRRPGEAIARSLAPLINRLMIGKLRRYRAIDADAVARAIVRLLGFDAPGQVIHQNSSMEELANQANELLQ